VLCVCTVYLSVLSFPLKSAKQIVDVHSIAGADCVAFLLPALILLRAGSSVVVVVVSFICFISLRVWGGGRWVIYFLFL